MEELNSYDRKELNDPWSSITNEEQMPAESEDIAEGTKTSDQIESIVNSNEEKERTDSNALINPQVVTSSKKEFSMIRNTNRQKKNSFYKKITSTKFTLNLITLILIIYIIRSLYIIL